MFVVARWRGRVVWLPAFPAFEVGHMKATELANKLLDAAAQLGDFDVVCRDKTGKAEPAVHVVHLFWSNVFIVCCEAEWHELVANAETFKS
jgi:hypothetical protein